MSYGSRTLIFAGEQGIVDVRALVPLTKESRLKGLRDYRFLPMGSGMLFEFTPWESPALTMSGMSIALDIIYITRQPHTVLKVTRAHPGQERVEGPRGTSAALEVCAGWAKHFGVRPGTQVRVLP